MLVLGFPESNSSSCSCSPCCSSSSRGRSHPRPHLCSVKTSLMHTKPQLVKKLLDRLVACCPLLGADSVVYDPTLAWTNIILHLPSSLQRPPDTESKNCRVTLLPATIISLLFFSFFFKFVLEFEVSSKVFI